MLHVVKIGWNESSAERMQQVLSYALQDKEYCVYETEEAFISYCRHAESHQAYQAVLFAAVLPVGGVSMSYVRLISWMASSPLCLEHWCGAVLIDGSGEWFTKKIGRELIFLANQAGCAFPGKPLVEATGSLYNFNTQAAVQGVSNIQAYKNSAARLAEKVCTFAAAMQTAPDTPIRRILVLHASSRKTSNTLLLWEMIRQHLHGAVDVEELTLRNGAVIDCRGCSYEACRHFGEQGECFYGGVIVEKVYPAIRAADAIMLICPNYNDAVSANLTAFFNRLTALFRMEFASFSRKYVYALVVSGYSGGDIVAEQVIDAMNCNKNFSLPGQFAMVETANDPQSILQCEGIEKRAVQMAERLLGRKVYT